MSQFNTGLPSVRQIQNFIKNKSYIEVGLMTNQVFEGKVIWQDSQSIFLLDRNDEKIIIWIQAIVYIKLSSSK
jgi:host factor-I protein